MKSLNVKICALIVVFGLIMSFSSCKKDEPGPGLVKFAVASASFSEADGDDKNVTVSISAKQSADVTITWTYSVASETYLNGDFSLPSTDAITIPAGQTTGHIVVHVIDDAQIDADDDVTLNLTAVTGNAKLSTTPADLKYDMTINNNDQTPANGMQIDLTWSQSSTDDIDHVDLDLYLDTDVTLDGSGNPSTGTDVQTSVNPSGFETVILNTSDPDGVYYVIVPYFSGTGAVDVTLTFYGFGYNGQYLSGSFTADQAPNGGNPSFVWTGPWTKTNSTFTGRVKANGGRQMGRVIAIRASDFKFQKK